MIDIGANLTNKRFNGLIPDIIEKSLIAGVNKIIVTGTDIESSKQALLLAQQYDNLYATAGIHPHDASSLNAQSIDELNALLLAPEVVAVGETGLDFNRNFSTKKEQLTAFEQQIELASNCQKPLFLHERDAFKEQYQILKEARNNISGAVVHCFTGNQEALEKYLELDFYIGITGWICDERRGIDLQKMVHLIPNERLLIETDAPYLTPRTLQGKAKKSKNVPANLPHIAEAIGKLRQQSTNEIATLSETNSLKLFNLNKGSLESFA